MDPANGRLQRMNVLGVIPARGGSKGLLRKNLRTLRGHSLLAWTIAAAKASGGLSRIVLSTDDDEIAEVGGMLGVDVPWLRPAELATDTATSMAVVRHALLECEREAGRMPYDAVCLLQPTSPLRRGEDVAGTIARFRDASAPSAVSVCELEHPLAWTVLIRDDGAMELPFLSGKRAASAQVFGATQRQSHQAAYRLNGAVYVYSRDTVMNHESGLMPDSVAYIMDAPVPSAPEMTGILRSIDIDTETDLRLAEAIAHAFDIEPQRE